MEVIQNKKDHNSYRGETSDKGNVRWRIPLFLPFGHEKWNKKSKHLPAELDHPASDEIRRDSDRIIGHNYIKNMIFDFSETVFMDSSGIGLLMGRYRALGMRGKCVQVVNVNSHIAKLLRLSGVGKYIEICGIKKSAGEQEGVYDGKHK